MTLGTLLFCTAVLYAPHALLCATALLWQPMLLILGVLFTFLAFLPMCGTGLVYQLFRLWQPSAPTPLMALYVLLLQLSFQFVVRRALIVKCLEGQRYGWQKGWLLVRSRAPFVSLSIAVGAGFATASLLVGGGTLLSDAWSARLTIPGGDADRSATAAVEAYVYGSSASCPQLPRLVQSCFHQAFYSCCHVAWAVLFGQWVAASARPMTVVRTTGRHLEAEDDAVDAALLAPAAVEEAAPKHSSVKDEGLGCAEEDRDGDITTALAEAAAAAAAAAAVTREELTRFALGEDELLPLVHAAAGETDGETPTASASLIAAKASARSARVSRETREEAEAAAHEATAPSHTPELATHADAQAVNNAAIDAPSGRRLLRQHQCFLLSSESLPSRTDLPRPVVLGVELVVPPQAGQRAGHACLALQLAATALSLLETSSISASAVPSFGGVGCAVYIPAQCGITLVSVAWALWIVYRAQRVSADVPLG